MDEVGRASKWDRLWRGFVALFYWLLLAQMIAEAIWRPDLIKGTGQFLCLLCVGEAAQSLTRRLNIQPKGLTLVMIAVPFGFAVFAAVQDLRPVAWAAIGLGFYQFVLVVYDRGEASKQVNTNPSMNPAFVSRALASFSGEWRSDSPWGLLELEEALAARTHETDVASDEWVTSWLEVIARDEEAHERLGKYPDASATDELSVTYAPYCILADLCLNPSEAQAALLELVETGKFAIALEKLMDELQLVQSNTERVILPFEVAQSLISLNTRWLDLRSMTRHQLHMALEVRFHYLLQGEEMEIASILKSEHGAEGAQIVSDLARQSGQRSRMLKHLGVEQLDP